MNRWQGLSAMLGSFFRERKVLAGTLVGLFIPAIYCVLYLNAIWDPYGKTQQVPGVIINLDQPATLNGKPLQLGADLTDELLKENKLAWQTGTDEAAALAQLREGKQLIVLTIPGDFSSSVAGLAKANGAAPAPIRYYANQGQSLIVSQLGDRMTELLREQLNDKVAAQVLAELIGTLGQGQSGLLQAASGARELEAGAGQLADGAATLTSSLEKAQQGARQLGKGAAGAANGSQQLTGGIGQLQSGSASAAKQTAAGAAAVQQLGEQLSKLAADPQLPEATSRQLAQLAAQTQQLGAGFQQGAQSLSALAAGSGEAYRSSQQLSAGLKQLSEGVASLQTGLGQGADGAGTLKAKLGDLQSGLTQMADKLTAAGSTENTLQGKEELLAAPVAIDRQPVHPVPNNGTFFAGFFGPMSLWVGAFLFSFLTLMVKWQGWARRSLLPRYALLAVLGTLQALVLDLVLIQGLGLQVDDLGAFVLMTVLTSLSFISIVHFILAMTGVAGNLIVLVLLVFQLGLSGGSYPVAMLSAANQTLSQWAPLTYAVQGFRIAISGGSSAVLQSQVLHLLLFLAVGLGLHVAYGVVSRIRSRTRRGSGQQLQLSELPE
ncbi:YhgE/Pip domain-containing protein [Paenibacillus athensensis]|nr:YhgE/Pip domain-containing protein [Paenibacillus athensensis]MCD1259059.1 YhgE/Pip domain-containing protein [Paenibacillus athensensis]